MLISQITYLVIYNIQILIEMNKKEIKKLREKAKDSALLIDWNT